MRFDTEITGVTAHRFEVEAEISHLLIKTNSPIGSEEVTISLIDKRGSSQTLSPSLPLKDLAALSQVGEGSMLEIENVRAGAEGTCYYYVAIGNGGSLILDQTEKLVINFKKMAAGRTYDFYGAQSLERTKQLFDYHPISVSKAETEKLFQTTKIGMIAVDPGKIEVLRLNHKILGGDLKKSLSYHMEELKFMQIMGNDLAINTNHISADGGDDNFSSIPWYNKLVVPLNVPTSNGVYYTPNIEVTTNAATDIIGVQMRDKNETESAVYIAEKALSGDNGSVANSAPSQINSAPAASLSSFGE